MALWAARPVSEQPEIILGSWRIYEVPDGTRHFVGKLLNGGGGRVSSSINVFDKMSMSGITRSGRVYTLIGDPGFNADADYVWKAWMQGKGFATYEDVTSEVSMAPSAAPLVDPSMEAGEH